MAEVFDDDIDFSVYMRATEANAKVRPASAWIDHLKDRLRKKATEKRYYLPWQKVNDCFDFRAGELTIWGGINGHGKSLVTAFVALYLMAQGQKVCIANFELKPHQTLERMARMFCGMNPFSPEFQNDDGLASLDDLYERFGKWSDGKLWIYDQHGTANADQVIAVTKYCARELKIDHIFIDNLAKCVKGEDDYNGQKDFIDQMFSTAQDDRIHAHVVHHMRKGAKETDFIDKNDFKGSGAIADQPDNLIGVWRNKAKENDAKVNGSNSKFAADPDVVLKVFKQRNYDGNVDDEPQINLWFDRDSWQYKANQGDRLINFEDVSNGVASRAYF
jgi:twinkle protein